MIGLIPSDPPPRAQQTPPGRATAKAEVGRPFTREVNPRGPIELRSTAPEVVEAGGGDLVEEVAEVVVGRVVDLPNVFGVAIEVVELWRQSSSQLGNSQRPTKPDRATSPLRREDLHLNNPTQLLPPKN